MKVLLSGHGGYIGALLAPLLAERGHEVHGLDSFLFEESTYGDPPTSIPELRKDIRDVEPDDLAGYDAVLHLAGLSNDPLGDFNPQLTFDINYHASVRLAQLAKQAGVTRFVFSSSCSYYGAGGGDFLDESAECNPVTPYGRSKVLVERDVALLADDNFSPTFLRNATAFGVSPRLRFDLVLNNLVAWAFTQGSIHMKSDGMAWRPLVHIEDIARAFVAAIEAPRDLIHNEAFNVGRSEDNYLIRDLAEIVRETVPNAKVNFAPGSGPDKRTYRVNCEKFARTFPNMPLQWNARRGAQQLYEEYCRLGLSLDDFEGARYKRITHLRGLIDSGRIDANLRWSADGLRAPYKHFAA
jgi:nucleoside-diphosphate-sugar epimerase